MSFPVFIVCRNRHTTLIDLLGWLESVGNADEVYLIDNGSTWPPLLDLYETTDHTVIQAAANHGHKVGWTQRIIAEHSRRRRFIYTDPDVLPVEDCPPDAIERMADVLDRTSAVKVGFSIKIDDVPAFNQPAVDWETKYWTRWDAHAQAWKAPIDTTFALYDARQVYRHAYVPSFRLDAPYSVRHVPWYDDPHDLDAESRYYVDHADLTVSNWSRDVIETTA